MAVQYTARGIGDRVLLIVALGEHGIERGDGTAALLGIAGALDQAGQLGEYRRRITLGCRRLADGQGDFTLGLGVAGQ